MYKKAIYIYPTNRDSFVEGNNNYIKYLIEHLNKDFKIVSGFTKIGLFDVLFKINKCDILYFNWIGDIPKRKFGMLQLPALFFIIALSKIFRKKLVWFVHNNVSHDREHFAVKKMIVNMMKRHADIILTHSSDYQLPVKNKKVEAFDHPLDFFQPITTKQPAEYDLLIWGTVFPYKGISEFLDYIKESSSLKDLRILIAGKFCSNDYYEHINAKKTQNVSIINKKLSETELIDLFAKSKYILFTYNSPSVLSSAALCKSLSFGKEIIGPNLGSFKELGRKGVIYNYESFDSLESLLENLKNNKVQSINTEMLADYARKNLWPDFAKFLSKTLNKA